MKQIALALLLLFTLGSCKEYETAAVAYLKNTTSRSILILPHKGGVVRPGDTIRLAPSEELQVGEYYQLGQVNHGGFHSDRLFGTSDDSILVVFDDRYTVAHYVKMPGQTSGKYYDYTSRRNLANYLSYDYTYEDKTKHQRVAHYRYSFVDSDYVFSVH